MSLPISEILIGCRH